jgi:hypothetical protein
MDQRVAKLLSLNYIRPCWVEQVTELGETGKFAMWKFSARWIDKKYDRWQLFQYSAHLMTVHNHL